MLDWNGAQSRQLADMLDPNAIEKSLRTAYAAGNLLSTVATVQYAERGTFANELVRLHNSQEIDFLSACTSEELDRMEASLFFKLQTLFCEYLPRIDCNAMDAATACNRMLKRTGKDLSAQLVVDALQRWFQQCKNRVKEGLDLLQRDTVFHRELVRPVVKAGACYDGEKFTTEALALSRHADSSVRLKALSLLGEIVPASDNTQIERVISRCSEVVDCNDSDREIASVIRSVSELTQRIDGAVSKDVERLFVSTCKKTTPIVRSELAFSLSRCPRNFSPTMIEAAFDALKCTDRTEHQTIEWIDTMLYGWELDIDRERVVSFLQDLLFRNELAVEMEQLEYFRHKLAENSSELLGWYVVYFLLTGDNRLCRAACRLLPSHVQDSPKGLDLDLSSFNLSSLSILFLARKIIGYCLSRPRCATALLLSCLRVVSDKDRPELERLVFDYFAMNYIQSKQWFKELLEENDPAGQSVGRLSTQVEQYIDDFKELGSCPAFAPSDRDIQLQRNHNLDLWRNAWKRGQQASILANAVKRVTVLYGSRSISYVYDNTGDAPSRKEIPLISHRISAEFPGLNVLDPVGLECKLNSFREELPPQ